MLKICKYCTKEKNDFYKNNTYIDGYSNTCIECTKENHRKYYLKNKDNIAIKSKIYKSKNKQRNNELSRKYNITNKENRNISRKKWNDKNKLLKSVLNRNWNAKKLGAIGSFTLQEYLLLLNKCNNMCGYCKAREAYTIDHIKPISKGGSNFIENIMPACLKCNGQKRDYLLEEWLALPNCFNKNK